MKRSEKLLDAIGQIDDRLVEEAGKAGNVRQEAKEVLDKLPDGDRADRDKKAGKRKKKANGGKHMLYRWQGALAACAVIAVCAGIFGILERKGMIFSPYGKSASDMAEMISESPGAEEAGQEEAASPAELEAMPEAAKTAGAEEAARNEGQGSMATGENADQSNMASGENADQSGMASGENADQAGMASGKEPDQGSQENATAKQQNSFAGDAKSARSDQTAEEAKDESGGVIVSVKESSAESVTFVLENESDETVCYDAKYGLERMTGESWEPVQPKEEVAWKDVAYYMRPGSSSEITANLGLAYGKLQAGQYRIVKEYWPESDEGSPDYDKYWVYVEFTVTD